MAISITEEEKEQLEIKLLFEAVYQCYGYDFRNYSQASARRRVLRKVAQENVSSISMLQHKVLHDESIADALIKGLSINVTEMFRDPLFYKAVRDDVLPELSKLKHLKSWHAGCATGEEVYSMAILLKEQGLLDHTMIYATDFSQIALDAAKNGVFAVELMQQYSRNYNLAGCDNSLSDYYYAKYDHAIMSDVLKKPLVFSHHNLATDGSFAEVQLLICRNVLIYFDRELQERVFQLFTDSLSPGGFLCLGSHESLKLSAVFKHYKVVNEKQKIYRKM